MNHNFFVSTDGYVVEAITDHPASNSDYPIIIQFCRALIHGLPNQAGQLDRCDREGELQDRECRLTREATTEEILYATGEASIPPANVPDLNLSLPAQN